MGLKNANSREPHSLHVNYEQIFPRHLADNSEIIGAKFKLIETREQIFVQIFTMKNKRKGKLKKKISYINETK